jgi:hypothetical protein
MRFHLSHVTCVPLGVPEMVSMHMVQSAQTMQLTCVEINTVSKPIETSFHSNHITLEYHQVRQNDF